MTKKIKNIKGKIGYCSNKDLHIKNKYGTSSNGHYVYIRKVNKNGTCDVSTITSLETEYSTDKTYFINDRLRRVRFGKIYAIPIKDSNFSRWSGVSSNVIKNVDVKNIYNVGNRWIKKRHIFVIGKNNKKK